MAASCGKASRQRGEGMIGCVVTLLVLLLAGAVGVKIVPVFYTNNNLQEFAGELASKAGLYALPALELQLRDKAKELEIPEALAKQAMTITVSGEKTAGLCTINLSYARSVDFYGVYALTIETQKSITKPYMDAR